jgi:hypothetical protein
MILLRKFIFYCLLLSGPTFHAQSAARNFLAPMQPDSLVLLVCQLDSNEFYTFFDPFGMEPGPIRPTRFRVYASNDPCLTGKTIEVRIMDMHFRAPLLPFHNGWTGQIKVTRNWTRFPPFQFYWFEGFPQATETRFFRGEKNPLIISKPFVQPRQYIRLHVEITDSTPFPMPLLWVSPEPWEDIDPPACRFKVLPGSDALNEFNPFESELIDVFVTNAYRYGSFLQKGWKGVIFVNYECPGLPPSCGYYLKAVE